MKLFSFLPRLHPEEEAQLERVVHNRQVREAEDARQAAGARRHFVLAHDWGDERHHGAHMIAHSVGERVAPRREHTPVFVDFFARFNPGTAVEMQIEKTRERLAQLRHDFPQAAIHYCCDLSGYGSPGFLYLLRSDALAVKVVYTSVTLTNQGEDQDHPARRHEWTRSKQKLIYAAAAALPHVHLPPADRDKALAQLPLQLKAYRFTNTEKQMTGLQALRDTVNDDLVVTFALAVHKLQERGKTLGRYDMGFLSSARRNDDDDGLEPLLPSFQL